MKISLQKKDESSGQSMHWLNLEYLIKCHFILAHYFFSVEAQLVIVVDAFFCLCILNFKLSEEVLEENLLFYYKQLVPCDGYPNNFTGSFFFLGFH